MAGAARIASSLAVVEVRVVVRWVIGGTRARLNAGAGCGGFTRALRHAWTRDRQV
jgi:hypothetical protein